MEEVIFSIDNTHVPADQSLPFVTSPVTHTDIPDGTEISTRAFNKMATSIPTPFARVYLFNAAFEALVALEEWSDGADNHPYKGIAFYGTPDVTERENYKANLNHYVVADCLDMLEFLFEYGNDPRLVIEKWDSDALEELHTKINPNPNRKGLTTEEKHNNLYNALKSDTIDGKIGNTIYIFKWVEGDKSYIIGGSSPFTLVYTAPNWRSIKPKGVEYAGGVGNELFTENLTSTVRPLPLVERSESFRKYLYGLLDVYAGDNTNAFFKYIFLTKENYDYKWDKAIVTKEKLNAAFSQLKNDVEEIEVVAKANTEGPSVAFNVPLLYHDKNQLDRESDYLIVPTVDTVFEEYTKNGEKVEVGGNKKPLVLSVTGIQGKNDAHYWYEAKIGRQSSALKVPSTDPYYERLLPNVPGSIQHPNIRVEDFLEDKIIKTGYHLDRVHFITGTSGHCQYLLPIKPLYFKFFKPEDLKTNFSMTEGKDGSVTVTLNIPVTAGNVVFTKTYRNDSSINQQEIVIKDKFNLAIFPFYRLKGNDSKYNCYEVMLGHDGKTKLKFYNEDVNEFSENEMKAIQANGATNRSIVHVESVTNRTEDDSQFFGIYTTYYKLGESESKTGAPTKDGSFLFLQSRFGEGLNGLVVPDWSASKEKFGNDQYVFCVDFGTANTHIAYAQVVNNSINAGNLKDLEYNPGEQVVVLNEAGSSGQFKHFDIYFEREFVPMKIVKGGNIEFPIRTIIYERAAAGGKPKHLFGDMNIGFSLKEDSDTGQGNGLPKSNIKWDDGTSSKNRISAFFAEVMWMIKNKVLSMGGSIDFKFLFTFPSSMRESRQNDFINEWDNARRAVRGGLTHGGAGTTSNNWSKSTVTNSMLRLKPYEGITPWYRSLAQHNQTESFLNVDIGGGTFDVIAIQPDINRPKIVPGVAFSAQFAAVELWGQGQNKTAHATNGFLTNYLNSMEGQEYDQENRGFANYRKTADSTADTIAYLFKNDERSKFSDTIRANKKLRSLVFMHFASIIYYVGRVMLLAEIECPKVMRFTGMGSLYIDLITDNVADLTPLVRAILHYAASTDDYEFEIPADFTVEYDKNLYHPKKITAEGGVIMWETTIPGSTMPIVDTSDVIVYGFEGNDDYLQPLKENEVSKKQPEVMERMKHFLGMFKDPEIVSFLNSIDMTDMSHLEFAKIKDKLNSSFNLMAVKYNNGATDTDSKEAIFFWPLKDSIHALADEYVK